jgi:hypothetical protein
VSQIRLYLDEDVQRRTLTQALRNAGLEVITTTEAGNVAQDDNQQLIWAAEQSYTLYSFNVRDFNRIHTVYMTQGMEHSGIILAERQSYSIGDQLRGLLLLVADKSAEDIKNQLVFLGPYIRAK